MPEIIEQTTTGKTTTKWWTPYMTPQTMVWVLAAFVYGVVFWKDSHDNWDKTNELEEKVNRQYNIARDEREKLMISQKEDREREFKAIEEVADWMHYEKGRQAGYLQAVNDMKK